MKLLAILLFVCIFVVLCRNGIIIEGLENEENEENQENEENDSCDNDGFANSDFNDGMQYALDKKIAKGESDEFEDILVNSPRSCFTKGYNAIYHNINTGSIFK